MTANFAISEGCTEPPRNARRGPPPTLSTRTASNANMLKSMIGSARRRSHRSGIRAATNMAINPIPRLASWRRNRAFGSCVIRHETSQDAEYTITSPNEIMTTTKTRSHGSKPSARRPRERRASRRVARGSERTEAALVTGG